MFKQITFPKAHTMRQFELGRVLIRERERIVRNIDSNYLCLGKFDRQAKRNNTAAGSDIQNFGFWISDFGFEEFNELLCLRPWHHRTLIAKKNVPAKFDGAEQMLKWLAFTAPPHQSAQRREFPVDPHAFKFQIEIDALSTKHVRKQVLGVQTRALDAVLVKIRSGCLQHLQDSHDCFRCLVMLAPLIPSSVPPYRRLADL